MELDLLRSELAAAVGGSGRLVLLVGEPGIGKTRTATALAEEAHRAGAWVAWGRCHQGEVAPAYWPWLQALRMCASELSGRGAAELSAIVDLLQASSTARSNAAAPESARFELFARVASALEAVGRERPLVVVLDDLQWADGDSLRLLEFVARELSSERLMILGTAREFAPGSGPVAQRLAAMARLGRSVTLAGLLPRAVHEILVEHLEHEPDEAMLERIHRITGGNPFFVIELAHLLATDASLSGRVLPPAAHEVLRERLAPLSPDALRLLESASVLGHEFDLDPLSVALEQSVDGLVTTLREPVRLGLVQEIPGTLRRYAFTHALLREMLYSDLGPTARSALHLELARALEAAGAANDDRLTSLAHHFFEAARTSNPSEAIRYGCEAGERAQRSLAYDEAMRCFEQVLAALDLAADERARLRAQAGLGEALYGAGETARAETEFRDAVALARTLGSDALSDTILRWALVRTEVGVPSVELNGLLEEALAALPRQPSVLRARVMARLAAGLHVQPRSEARRQELAENAIEMAESLNDAETLGFVRAHALIGLLGPDNLAQRLSATEEILRSAGAGGAAGIDALLLRMGDLAESSDRAGLDQALAALEQRARASGRPFYSWSALVARSGLALLEGRFEAAEALVAEALALGKKVEPQAAVLRFVQQCYPLRAWQGRIDEVTPLIEQAVSQIEIPAWRAALAYAYDIGHRRTEARREFDALAADHFAALPRDTTWLSGMVLIANLCGRLGDAPRAGVLYDLMLPYRDRIAVNRPLVIAVGPVALCLGVLSSVGGQYEAADAHFTEALALAERMRALPWQAETRFQWARMLFNRGMRPDFDRASSLLDEAETAATAMGMVLLLDWIAACRNETGLVSATGRTGIAADHGEVRSGQLIPLTRCGGRDAAEAAPPITGRRGTFRREGEVWTLEFEGRTTRLRSMVGLAHLAELMARPDHEAHVTDLIKIAFAAPREPNNVELGDAGEHLDERARADYETRLRDARQDLAEAERHADQGRRQRLNEEIEFLAAELARGFGLGGRSRRAASANERARISVSRAIKYAINKIGDHDPALADHLRRSVRTGAFCAYAPSMRDRVAWTL